MVEDYALISIKRTTTPTTRTARINASLSA